MPTPVRRRPIRLWPVEEPRVEPTVIDNVIAALAEATEKQRIEKAEIYQAALEIIKQEDRERKIREMVNDIRLGVSL